MLSDCFVIFPSLELPLSSNIALVTMSTTFTLLVCETNDLRSKCC